jgi:hypothetical protein
MAYTTGTITGGIPVVPVAEVEGQAVRCQTWKYLIVATVDFLNVDKRSPRVVSVFSRTAPHIEITMSAGAVRGDIQLQAIGRDVHIIIAIRSVDRRSQIDWFAEREICLRTATTTKHRNDHNSNKH